MTHLPDCHPAQPIPVKFSKEFLEPLDSMLVLKSNSTRSLNGTTHMGWATHHISKLQNGETVSFRPRGHSIKGKIESGQLCTVIPIIDVAALELGDIVLCKVRGNQHLHLIKAKRGSEFQIGNNRGGINGWIGSSLIYGKCIRLED